MQGPRLNRRSPESTPMNIPSLSKKNRRRLLAKLGLATALLLASYGFQTLRAQAFSLNGCNWNTTSVSYRDAYANSTNLDQATDSWNVRAARLRFNRVYSGGDITVYSANAGNTGWVGLTHGNGTGGSPYDSSYSCTTGNTNVTRNGYYSANDQWVFAHEFGHAVGLDHNNATTTCPSGGTQYTSLMYYSQAASSGNCPALFPQPDDVTGVDSRY
jgi:Metallo-peptidase family M12B Reprolysin-like